MYRYIIIALACLGLACAAVVADLGPPGTEKGSTVTGVSVEGAPVCEATNLSRETKTLFNRWIEGTVVQLDGRDYLVDYCVPEHPCVRVIQKSETFIRDK